MTNQPAPRTAAEVGAALAPLASVGFSMAASVQAAADYQRDQLALGEAAVKALLEISTATPWSRQEWTDAWTGSRAYRRAIKRLETPDVHRWLDTIRTLADVMPIPDAMRLLNSSETGYEVPIP